MYYELIFIYQFLMLRSFVFDIKKVVENIEQTNKTQIMFLANLSLEMKTPLNTVIGITDLLLISPLNIENKELNTLIEKKFITYTWL